MFQNMAWSLLYVLYCLHPNWETETDLIVKPLRRMKKPQSLAWSLMKSNQQVKISCSNTDWQLFNFEAPFSLLKRCLFIFDLTLSSHIFRCLYLSYANHIYYSVTKQMPNLICRKYKHVDTYIFSKYLILPFCDIICTLFFSFYITQIPCEILYFPNVIFSLLDFVKFYGLQHCVIKTVQINLLTQNV